jgi:1,5-anhydro-D-fructose reductase (1,5-anhydro-D-mannitol-forming)
MTLSDQTNLESRTIESRTVRWGIVGCGWVARDYVAPGIVAAPHAELAALCDPDDRARGRIAALAPQAAPHADLDAFLATPGLDAVYVATPNHLHAPIVEAAARAGKHVLCEKPMATSVEDAERMVVACREAGVQYATAFDQRFQAYHRRLRDLIAAGRMGTITAVRIHYACWTPVDWRPPTDDGSHDNWRVDPNRAGGGAFIDLAPHGLDLTQYLLDDEIEEVACLLQRHVHAYPVDDGAALIGRLRGGALLTHNVAYNCPDAFPRRTLEIVGTEAMAIARNTMGQTPGGSLQLIDHDGAIENIVVDPAADVSPFQTQIAHFSRSVITNTPFPFTPERDLHTMRLLDAAQQGNGGIISAKTREDTRRV